MQTPHVKQIGHQLGQHLTLQCHDNQKLTHIKLTDLTKHTPTNLCNPTTPQSATFDFNQSVIKLSRNKTELTHSTQCLQQQSADALINITKSSYLQENLHFINDIPIFKVKDLQTSDEWLGQIDKVISLMNKDPYKLALPKSQGLFSRTISSYSSTLGWNKIKE